MSEQRIDSGAAAAAGRDEAGADTAATTDADTATSGEESVKAAYGAAAGQGADTDPAGTTGRRAQRPTDSVLETDSGQVPPESDRS
jgi:hypothetical protein